MYSASSPKHLMHCGTVDSGIISCSLKRFTDVG